MTVSLLFRNPIRNITHLFLDFLPEPIWFQYISVYNNSATNTESQCSVQQLSEICRSRHRIEETLQNSENQLPVKAVLRKHYGFLMPLPFLEELIPVDFRVDDRPRAGKDSITGQESKSCQKKALGFC